VGSGVLALAPKDARVISADKRGGKPPATQADVSHALIDLARHGRRVLRLNGGDPFIFGRSGEEILALGEAGVPFWVIPGLTAGIAALAAASIPETLRGVNQAVVLMTGRGADHEEALDWAALAALRQPVSLYMAMRRLAPITEKLLAYGAAPQTPAAVITDATLPGERMLTTTLAALPSTARGAKLEPPGIVVVGDVVATRRRIERPLGRMEAAR
jgi:uroporphyrin-III C-methyltransferase